MRWQRRVGALWLGLGLPLMAAAAADTELLQFSDAFVREMPPGHAVSGAFLTVTNTGEQPVRIVGGECTCAETVEIHEHVHHEGMMRMQPVAEVKIGAGDRFAFQPGGFHLMLIGLKEPLRHGDTVGLALIDANGGRHTVAVPVVATVRQHRH